MSKSEVIATLIEDKNHPGDFRVEAIDDDGGCEVSIFTGPRARERAIAFAASTGFYDGWTDPQGWDDGWLQPAENEGNS